MVDTGFFFSFYSDSGLATAAASQATAAPERKATSLRPRCGCITLLTLKTALTSLRQSGNFRMRRVPFCRRTFSVLGLSAVFWDPVFLAPLWFVARSAGRRRRAGADTVVAAATLHKWCARVLSGLPPDVFRHTAASCLFPSEQTNQETVKDQKIKFRIAETF